METIAKEIKEQAQVIIDNFNKNIVKNSKCFYTTRFRANYLYLDIIEFGEINKVARLKSNGHINNWEFAPYKYSNNSYDIHDPFFPGYEHAQKGTIEGALKAAMELYPISEDVEISFKKVLGDLTNKYYPEPPQKKKSAYDKKLDAIEKLSKSGNSSDLIFMMEDLESGKKKPGKKKK